MNDDSADTERPDGPAAGICVSWKNSTVSHQLSSRRQQQMVCERIETIDFREGTILLHHEDVLTKFQDCVQLFGR